MAASLSLAVLRLSAVPEGWGVVQITTPPMVETARGVAKMAGTVGQSGIGMMTEEQSPRGATAVECRPSAPSATA